MAMTVEELAARLNAEAARRGISSEHLLDELAAHLPTQSDRTERFAFAGMGHSGRGDLAERHKQIRDELIAEQRAHDE
jgi:hypothetical protein